MTNKYEHIVLREFNSGQGDGGGILNTAINKLISAFSDTGAIGLFTDILTGDRAAKQYTADPVGQRIFKSFFQPAVNSAKKGDLKESFDILSSGVDKINFFIDSYKINLRKYTNDPNIKNIVDKTQGYAWYPEQVIGVPTSKSLSRISAIGKAGYNRFPQAVEFQDSVKQGVSAICEAAKSIIGMRYEDILSDPILAQQAYDGIGEVLKKINYLSSIQFTIRAAFLTYTTFDVQFDLSDLISDVNKDSRNVISDLVEFMDFLKGSKTVFEKFLGKDFNQNKNSDNIDLDKVTNEVMEKILSISNEGKVLLSLNEEDLEEQSVVANIAGYSLPLGASNQEDPDKEMEDSIQAMGWSHLDVSTSNISPNSRDSVEKGSENLFKSRKARS